MVIRGFRDGDVADVVRCFTESVRTIAAPYYDARQIDTWAPLDANLVAWHERLSNGEVLVADVDGAVAGFVRVESSGYVDLLYVHPAHVRRGVGMALLRAACSWALANGAKRFDASVSLAARPFFEAAGFRVEREQLVEHKGVTFRNSLMTMDAGAELPSCRDATLADLHALARVHVDVWRSAYAGIMDPSFLASLAPEHALVRLRPALEHRPPLVVVLEHEREVVGFTRFGPPRDADASSRVGEVFACSVRPQYWRRGFGRQLMLGALARLAASGYEGCTLWVLEQNVRAREFYAALGFAPDGATRVEAAGTRYPLPELRYSRVIQ